MSTSEKPQTGGEMVVSDRQQRMVALRDNMEPGAKPTAIVPRSFAEAQVMCGALAAASLVPEKYRERPQDMIVVVLAGAEIGIPPMAALRLYHIMDSVPRLSAEGVRAVILSHPDCEYFEPASSSETQATWVGKKRGRPEKTVTWTIERAKRAGLTERRNRDGSPGNWIKYPEDMLNARASMQLGRMIWPHIVAGMISREEAMDGAIDAEFTEAKPTTKSEFVAPPPPAAAEKTPSVQNGGSTADPPRRGPGRPPKDKPIEAQATEKPAEPSSSAASSPSSAQSAPTPSSSSSPKSSEGAAQREPMTPAKLQDVVTESMQEAKAEVRAADPSPAASTPAASEPASSGSTGSGAGLADDFGDDPVDQPGKMTMEGLKAWLLGCQSLEQINETKGPWLAWRKDNFPDGSPEAKQISQLVAERRARLTK